MSAIESSDARLAEVYAEEYAACIRQHMPDDRARFWAEHAVAVERRPRGRLKGCVRDERPAPANASELVARIRAAAADACGVAVAEFERHPCYFKADPPKRERLTCARRWVLVAARRVFGSRMAGKLLDTHPSWVRGACAKLGDLRPDLREAAEKFGDQLKTEAKGA